MLGEGREGPIKGGRAMRQSLVRYRLLGKGSSVELGILLGPQEIQIG